MQSNSTLDDKQLLQKIHPWMEGMTIAYLIERPLDIQKFLLTWLSLNKDSLKKPKIDEQMLSRREENKELLSKINPMFEELVVELLIKRPDDIVGFMENWIQTMGSNFLDEGKRDNIKQQRQQQIQNQSQLQPQNQQQTQQMGNQRKDQARYQLSDDEDDVVDDHEIGAKKNNNRKQGVSAEVFGANNPKANFKPRNIPKKPEQIQRIKARLAQAFMFQNLDEKEKEIVIGAMEEKKYSKGQVVIKQGDDGAELYIVDSGELDCHRVMQAGQKPTLIKKYKAGESFGELSLLYNAPRAATITATSASVLWALDRDTFNNIVKDSSIKKRQRYESVLQKIEILKTMDVYERNQIADVLKQRDFKKNDFIFKQGDKGDDFFMVEEGQLVAIKDGKNVKNIGPGDYFGELALMNDQPRAASIQATTDGILVSLDRESFKRMIGPIESLLKRNAQGYQKGK